MEACPLGTRVRVFLEGVLLVFLPLWGIFGGCWSIFLALLWFSRLNFSPSPTNLNLGCQFGGVYKDFFFFPFLSGLEFAFPSGNTVLGGNGRKKMRFLKFFFREILPPPPNSPPMVPWVHAPPQHREEHPMGRKRRRKPSSSAKREKQGGKELKAGKCPFFVACCCTQHP